jgi:hypothetical protein
MAGVITFKRNLNLTFLIVGLGANGSHFFRGLCQDISTHLKANYKRHHHPFGYTHIMLADGDKVEEKNLGNQIFEEDEIGEWKVNALAGRYGDHYGLEVFCKPDYIQEHTMISKMLQSKHYSTHINLPIIIGMVDNHATRQLIDSFFRSNLTENLLYIDAGVHEIKLDAWNNPMPDTGNGGQIVCGLKYKNEIILEPVGGLYPEVLTDIDSKVPSCGEIVESAPQRLTTNKLTAQLANNLINTLLTERSILVNQLTFDSRLCGVRPTFVSKAQEECFDKLDLVMFES